MIQFLRIIKAELKKSKGTYGFLISMLIPLLITLLQFLIFYIKHEFIAKTGMNPWKIMGTNLFNIFGIIVLPMYIVLISYLINFTEHQANSWKFLFSLPVPKFQIYSAKIVITLVWLFTFCFLTTILFFGTGQLLSILRPDIGFQDYNLNLVIVISMLKLFFTGFGILSIQFFLSIYWKDFIRPVGIGLGLTIAALILKPWDYVYLFPYSHPASIMTEFKELQIEIITTPILISFLYGIIFFSIGYYLVSRKEVL